MLNPVSRRTDLLDRIVGHLYFQAQKARDRREHELWSITLRLVGIARQGYEPTLDQAAYLVVGRSFEGWRRGTAERLQLMASELTHLIPDYDPTMEPASRKRRPEAFSGNLYEMPEPAQSPQQKPVHRVPEETIRDDASA